MTSSRQGTNARPTFARRVASLIHAPAAFYWAVTGGLLAPNLAGVAA